MATESDQHAAAKAEASPIALIERAKKIDPSAWRGDGSDDGHKRRMAAIRKARHAAAFGDHPQMAVALCRGGFGRGVRHRARSRRNDDGSVWIMLGNRLADPVLVVGAIGGKRRNGTGDLAEKRVNRRGIVDILPGPEWSASLVATIGASTRPRPPLHRSAR